MLFPVQQFITADLSHNAKILTTILLIFLLLVYEIGGETEQLRTTRKLLLPSIILLGIAFLFQIVGQIITL